VNKPAQRLAFKYRSGDQQTFRRDLESLQNATFYAAPRETLNDPFEGRFDRAALDSQFADLKTFASAFKPGTSASLDAVSQAANELLGFVDKSGIFSLSHNPLNELIWAHYGGSHRGYCVGYDLQKLVEFEPTTHYCLDVTYGDAAPRLHSSDLLGSDSPEAVLQKLLGAKSSPWQYEQEVRVITTPSGLHEHDYRATKTIYFGLRCAETTRLAVMDVLAGRGVAYKQVVSPQSSYRLKSVSIPDAYASAPKYKQNLAVITAGAIYPDYLKPEQMQYQEYLRKAAEIVRREPYCREVQLVDFSGSKSTPDQPVIFVQYLRAPNKWVNHYLTLPEIDRQYEQLRLENNDV
jgi:hypothetical protein